MGGIMKNLFTLVSVFLLSYTSLNNFNALSLIPGGENIAFEIYPNGIIITGTYDIKTDNQIYNPSIHSDIIKWALIRSEGKEQYYRENVKEQKQFEQGEHFQRLVLEFFNSCIRSLLILKKQKLFV